MFSEGFSALTFFQCSSLKTDIEMFARPSITSLVPHLLGPRGGLSGRGRGGGGGGGGYYMTCHAQPWAERFSPEFSQLTLLTPAISSCPTLQRKSHLCIPKKGISLSGPISTFMYLWAIDIFPASVHIFSFSRVGSPIVEIYKSLTDSWMWKLGLRNVCFEFSVLGLCSVRSQLWA